MNPPTSEPTGHTPGPWTAENHRVFSNIHDLPTLRHITTVTYQRNDAETYANARLIAAAPDLLAACEAALAGFAGVESGMGAPGMLQDLPVIAQLRSAIALARGGAA